MYVGCDTVSRSDVELVMFTFGRVGDSEAEPRQILLPEGSGPKLERRFEEPFGNGNLECPLKHEIRVLFAIEGCDETEALVAVKAGLSDSERKALDGEVEELL